MDSHPLISFCIPAFNVEGFLADCITSIVDSMRQAGEQCFEIICCDDGSTDASAAVFYECSALNEDIAMQLLRSRENCGVSAARNRCMHHAQGEFIWFVDADDMLCPGAVSVVLQALRSSEFDVLLGNYVRVAEDTTWRTAAKDMVATGGLPECPRPIALFNEPEGGGEAYLPSDASGRRWNAVWAMLIKREFLQEAGISFCEGMIAQEDTLFYFELVSRSPRAVKVEVPLVLYRQRVGSVMHTDSADRNAAYFQSMRIMYAEYQKYAALAASSCMELSKPAQHALTRKMDSCLAGLTRYLVRLSDNRVFCAELHALKSEGLYPLAASTLESLRGGHPCCLHSVSPVRALFARVQQNVAGEVCD